MEQRLSSLDLYVSIQRFSRIIGKHRNPREANPWIALQLVQIMIVFFDAGNRSLAAHLATLGAPVVHSCRLRLFGALAYFARPGSSGAF